MIDPLTWWFEIAQYHDKRAIYIVNLVETVCLYRYFIPIEIMYDQGSDCVSTDFRKFLIET